MQRTTRKRTYNVRRIKRDLSYRTAEIAELFDIHINTVHRWLKDGLPTIDRVHPLMVHGSDLIAFLRKRQSSRKHKCTPDEFWCCRCRLPRKAWENVADIVIRSPTLLNLKAVCGVCGGGLNKAGSVSRTDHYQEIFEIQTVTDLRLRG